MPGSKRATLQKSKRRLLQHLPLIEHLSTANPELWTYTLNNLTPEQEKLVVDVVRNFLKGHIPVRAEQLEQFKKKKRALRLLSKATNSKGRRVYIRQIGRGLLTILIPALASLIGGLVSK